MTAGPIARHCTILLARVYLGTLAGLAVVAAVTTLSCAGVARDWLGFGFSGLPNGLREAGSIFLDNLRNMIIVFAGALVAQWRWLGADPSPGPAWHALERTADVAILGLVLLNVVVIGAAVGGYGERMVVAMLPHGPVELLAFAGALTLYLLARRGPLGRSLVLALGGGSVLMLAVAGLLEGLAAP